MALFTHKGGSLTLDTGEVLHYGYGLDKDCTECKVKKHQLCITKSGNLLKKVHKCRL